MDAEVRRQLEQLAAYFNRHVLDVPDGFLDRNARYELNGVTYEAWLGRDASDPLVRLIARGPAGYRFVTKALLHALPDASVTIRDCVLNGNRLSVTIGLEGTLRGSDMRLSEVVKIDGAVTSATSMSEVAVTIDENVLRRLREARQQA